MSVNPFQPYGGQTAYQINTTNAFEGQLADLSVKVVRSYAALEALGFGLGVVVANAATNQCRLPMINSVALTESSATVSGNVIAGNVNVTTISNGARTTTTTAISPVTFATSDANTLALIATAIKAVTGVANATVSGSTITVTANNDTEVTLSGFVTTGGAGQNTWSTVNSTTDTFAGVSLFEQTIQNDLVTGAAIYPVGGAVNVLTMGRVYVTAENAVAGPATSVNWRFQTGAAGSQRGGWSATTDSGTCQALSRARWVDSIASGAVGVLEVSLP